MNKTIRAITTIVLLIICFQLSAQQKQVSITYWQGTKIKKVEYEYISGKAGTVGDLTIKDKNSPFVKERDFNNYSLNSMTPHGYWKEYYQNGQLQNEYNYDHGSREGVAKSFYENGKPKTVYSYKKNIIDGDYSEYYDNGQLQTKSVYVNGVRTGSAEVRGEKGNIIAYLTYSDPAPTGDYAGAGEKELAAKVLYQTKYPNGKIQEEGYLVSKYSQDRYPTTYYDDNFFREGVFTYYDENGVKTNQKNYTNNLLDGLSTTFYQNGNKKEETTYKLLKTTDRVLSIVDGPYLEYYENGQLSKSAIIKSKVSKASNGEYQADQLFFGPWKKYNESGKLIQFISYGENQKVRCEMDEKAIEEQSQISDQLGFELFKSRTIDKFDKYSQFHYGEMMTSFGENLNKADSYRFNNEIQNRAMEVFGEYWTQLWGCNDINCVKQYAGKIDNLLQKLYHIQNVNQVADKLLEPGQTIQNVLKI